MSAVLAGPGISEMQRSVLRKTGQLAGVFCIEQTGAQRVWSEGEKCFAVPMADLVSRRLMYLAETGRQSRPR